MASKYINYLVTGDPRKARATAEQALVSRGFKLIWHDDWTATAERGSWIANVIAGGFAQYFKMGVRLMSMQPGETLVRIERQTTGWRGGLVGKVRTNDNMTKLCMELEASFASAGVLLNVSEDRLLP
jgi:hypothetical protein